MWHGELCLLERSGDLLQGWQLPLSSSPAAADKETLAPSSSACWLRSLAQHLQHLRCAAQQHPLHAGSSGSRSSALFTSLEPSKEVLPGRQQPQDAASSNTGLGPAAEAALCALLQHPDPSYRALAAEAARQLALLCPLAALRLLPTLLNGMSKGRMELQRRVDSGLALQENAVKEGAGKAGEAMALWALLQVSRGGGEQAASLWAGRSWGGWGGDCPMGFASGEPGGGSCTCACVQVIRGGQPHLCVCAGEPGEAAAPVHLCR